MVAGRASPRARLPLVVGFAHFLVCVYAGSDVALDLGLNLNCGMETEDLAERQGTPDEMMEMLSMGKTKNASKAPQAGLSTYPGANTGTPLTVKLGVEIKRIWAISQKSMTYNVKYRLILAWVDCRLRFRGRNRIQVPDSAPEWNNFWRPEPTIVEEEAREAPMVKKDLLIFPDGAVVYLQERVSTMSCHFSFEDMPYDRHQCCLNVQLANYFTEEVNMVWSDSGRMLQPLIVADLSDSEWKFSPRNDWQLEVQSDADNKYNMQNKTLRASFMLERKAYHMMSSHFVPCIVYWFISYLAMWVDAAAVPGRAALHTLPVLMLANKLNAVQASLPNISYTTKLGSFLMATLILATLQLLEFCAVNAAARFTKYLIALEEARVKDEEVPDGSMEVAAGDKRTGCPPFFTSSKDSRSRKLRYRRMTLRVAMFGRDWMDTHSRWLFLVVYIATTLTYMC